MFNLLHQLLVYFGSLLLLHSPGEINACELMCWERLPTGLYRGLVRAGAKLTSKTDNKVKTVSTVESATFSLYRESFDFNILKMHQGDLILKWFMFRTRMEPKISICHSLPFLCFVSSSKAISFLFYTFPPFLWHISLFLLAVVGMTSWKK